MKTMNDYARECHEANIKWWLDLTKPCPCSRKFSPFPVEVDGGRLIPLKDCPDCHGHGYLMQKDRDLDELIALCISELMEALEGYRKNLMDDKLPHRRMAEVELADALIRMFDLAGGKGWPLGDVLKGGLNLSTKKESFPLKELKFATWLNFITENLINSIGSCGYHLSRAIAATVEMGAQFGYDLEGAYNEKMEYNRHRADHKIENRLAEGGKKF